MEWINNLTWPGAVAVAAMALAAGYAVGKFIDFHKEFF
jgi:hypothetical protein